MMKATTICAVKRNGVTAIAGDGQVTMGETTTRLSSDLRVLSATPLRSAKNLKKCSKNTAAI